MVPPIVMGKPLYFTVVVSSFFIFFSPILSSHTLVVYHNSTHDVVLVQI